MAKRRIKGTRTWAEDTRVVKPRLGAAHLDPRFGTRRATDKKKAERKRRLSKAELLTPH